MNPEELSPEMRKLLFGVDVVDDEPTAVEPITKKRRRKLHEMPGFRRRHNSYYAGMSKKQIAVDTAKTTAQWVGGTVFFFFYWLAMLLIFSLLLLSYWHVKILTLIIASAVLAVISSLIYGYVLVHRKFYY